MALNLLLVRHFAPQVAAGVCYGSTDLAVDPTLQSRALPALRARLPAEAALFCSPLRRCAGLAAELSMGAPGIDARLAELDFGRWEMRSWDAIARAEIDAWAADVVHHRPGGGESVFDMALRVHAFFVALRRAAPPAAVVVCHAGTMRLLSAACGGAGPLEMARAAAAAPHQIAYGEVLELAVDSANFQQTV